jgi:hypothetical protein
MLIAELFDRGILLQPHECVAIVQQLIHQDHDASRAPRMPFGPPCLDTVDLRSSGAAVCISADVTPAVAELAILLQALLTRTPQVPRPLQEIVGRALHEVDGPPFDSLADFSRALAPHEGDDRDAVIRGMLDRLRAPDSNGGQPAQHLVNRRRTPNIVSELRRDVREADRVRFERDMAHRAGRRRRRAFLARALAGAAAAVALMTAGEAFHLPRPTGAAVMPAPPKDVALPLPARIAPPDPWSVNSLVQPTRTRPAERKLPAHGRTTKRTAQAQPIERRPGRGFLGLRVISDTAVTSWRFVGRRLGL